MRKVAVECRERSDGAQSGLAMPGAVTYSALHHSTPWFPASPQSGETETQLPACSHAGFRSGESTERFDMRDKPLNIGAHCRECGWVLTIKMLSEKPSVGIFVSLFPYFSGFICLTSHNEKILIISSIGISYRLAKKYNSRV